MDDFNLGGFTVIGADEQTKAVLTGRDAFIRAYCQERGWNPADLSFDQIFEIRKQDGWKSPQ